MGYPVGYTLQAAIAEVRNRTNANFNQPPDAVIASFLNAGVEQVAARLDPILATVPIAVTSPNTSQFTMPADLERIHSIIYTTGSIFQPGTTPYPIDLLPLDQFIENTVAVGYGGPGGIPSIAAISGDSNEAMVLQIYPLVSSGFLNIYYYQRPTLWDPANTGSMTTMDSVAQEPVILWGCEYTLRYRELDDRAEVYARKFEPAVQNARDIIRKRQRKDQSTTVKDVTAGTSVWPTWVH